MLASPSAPLPPDPQHSVPICVPFRNPRGYCKPRIRIKPFTVVDIRWMTKFNFPEVAGIESASFSAPWTEEDFSNRLRANDTIGMVATSGNQVVGYMLYSFYPTHIELVNFAVDARFRRTGVGSQMAGKLKAKLDDDFVPRDALSLCVRETNIPACVFFRSQGFLWRETLPEHYPDTNEDAYVLEYQRVEWDRVPPDSIGHQNAPEYMP